MCVFLAGGRGGHIGGDFMLTVTINTCIRFVLYRCGVLRFVRRAVISFLTAVDFCKPLLLVLARRITRSRVLRREVTNAS